MRPARDDIGAPPLPAGGSWVGAAPASMAALSAAGPVLVHFLDFAQLNSVRTLPYLIEWDRRYRGAGLATIGVQAHRFPFGADPDVVAGGLRALAVEFPVLIDAERELWHEYGCGGWPSLYLWGRGGKLAWFHFGEGEYLATERAIQAALGEVEAAGGLADPMVALRETDRAGAEVIAPSPELFPGGSWEHPWTAGEDCEVLEISYGAGGAYATVEGGGRIEVELDGSRAAAVEVGAPALYALAEHRRHENHTITLTPTPGLRVWSIDFAAGVP